MKNKEKILSIRSIPLFPQESDGDSAERRIFQKKIIKPSLLGDHVGRLNKGMVSPKI